MVYLYHERPFCHGKSVNTEHVQPSDPDSKNSILDVKAFSNVDISSAEVHITEVVIKGLPKGDILLKSVSLYSDRTSLIFIV